MAQKKFNWKAADREVLLCREVLFQKPYQYKAGSKESGDAWRRIASNLNQNYGDTFGQQTQKSVRDHFNLLRDKRKQQVASENRASVIEVITEELDILLDEILEEIQENADRLQFALDDEKSAEDAEKKKQMMSV